MPTKSEKKNNKLSKLSLLPNEKKKKRFFFFENHDCESEFSNNNDKS